MICSLFFWCEFIDKATFFGFVVRPLRSYRGSLHNRRFISQARRKRHFRAKRNVREARDEGRRKIKLCFSPLLFSRLAQNALFSSLDSQSACYPDLQIRKGGGHPDKEVRRGRSQKFFRPFEPQFGPYETS